MYLERLICENAGPIDNLQIFFRKNNNDNPVPCVFVGTNGSGKSILLSFIVDALYEFADLGYENATEKNQNGHKYYKIINSNQIHIGKSWICTYAEFVDKKDKIRYLFKNSNCDFDDFKNRYSISDTKNISWNKTIDQKNVSISQEQSINIFETNVLCYFPPSRYEKPYWMGEDYNANDIMFSNYEKYKGVLQNPIMVNNVTKDTISWLLDITADSRPDLRFEDDDENKCNIIYPTIENLRALSNARSNVEKILGTILGKNIVFRMRHRGYASRRFSIYDMDANKEIIPSLDALSTGEMALFLMFSTIIRYADHTDVNKSINLDSIQGIVVIDEIDLHLHSESQRNIVAKLMKLFPKVQFIISTHSPLVLLGLEEEYRSELDIIEMPSGKRISSEQFSQFEMAFKYIEKTEKYRDTIRKFINDNKNNSRPLIITEGATDWMHMKAAYKSLCEISKYNWLKELELDFFEFHSKDNNQNKKNDRISGSELKTMALDYSRMLQSRKMIFIADRDVPNDVKALGGEDGFKDWGNNVYSLVLPVPEHRSSNPNISIELLYKDEDIIKWVNVGGIGRRIFFGNEFTADGHLYIEDEIYYCKDKNSVGPNKNTIIDGSNDRKVMKIRRKEDNINYALTKMDFAKMVMKKDKPFDSMDFTGFVPLFEMIRKILK